MLFIIQSDLKRGCVLAPILVGILFTILLTFAFRQFEEGVYLHTWSNGKLFNLVRLQAKTKVGAVLIWEMLFGDDAAMATHTEKDLQKLISQFDHDCNEFGLTINIKQ